MSDRSDDMVRARTILPPNSAASAWSGGSPSCSVRVGAEAIAASNVPFHPRRNNPQRFGHGAECWPNFGQHWKRIGKIVKLLANVDMILLANFHQTWPTIGPICPKAGQFRPTLRRVGQQMVRDWPQPTKHVPFWLQMAKHNMSWAKFDQHPSISANFGHVPATFV